MNSQFWRLQSPDYETDYRDSFINGSGRYLHGLPGMSCSVCKQTYGGMHVLPFSCPPTFQTHKNLLDGWPISEQEHLSLQARLLSELAASGIFLESLPPGSQFQPLRLKFPSRPKSDFLWPTLGSAVVSARVKSLFEQSQISGVTFCPAVIEKVGKRSSTGPVPIASTGEPEDIIEEIEPEKNLSDFGPLYEMVLTAESGRPPGAEVTSRCPVCGREEYDNARRQMILTEETLPDADVFFLATTLWIIVSEKVRDLVVLHRMTNVDLKPMEIAG